MKTITSILFSLLFFLISDNQNGKPELDHKSIKELNQQSTKEFKLFYSYASWCSPCRETLPFLSNFYEDNRDNVELYLTVVDTKEQNYEAAFKSLDQYPSLQKNLYILSNDYHKRTNKNYKMFVEEIIPGHTEYGLSLFILFDKENKVQYASTYNETKPERIATIEELIK